MIVAVDGAEVDAGDPDAHDVERQLHGVHHRLQHGLREDNGNVNLTILHIPYFSRFLI